MTRGRKPKPHNLQVIDGNPGKRRILSAPLNVQVLYEPPPIELADDEIAARKWNELMPDLVRYGLYCSLDRTELAGFCMAWSQAVQAHKALLERGSEYITESKNGLMHRHFPAFSGMFEALKVVRSFGSEFGLSPVSRKQLGDAGQGELPLDNFSRFEKK
jgi:P27 family predicted phage terminase small subunit